MIAAATPAEAHRRPWPTLSVIIPSHNRRDSIRRALLSLSIQDDYPLTQVEVIVVLDGSSDGSVAMLAELQPPFSLLVVEQDNQGSAAARNHGAARAGGEVLIFIDDDMEVSRSFLAEHVRPHTGAADRVVLGYFEADLGEGQSYFTDQLRGWWAATFRRMRSEGHRYAYTDLMSGNFSLRRSLFRQVGGFNVTLLRHHDYELGYRLLAAGAEFLLVEAAATVHHERSDLRRLLAGKVAEGMDDVQLGRLHPQLKPGLPMRDLRVYLRLPSRVMMHLAFSFPVLSDRMAQLLESLLGTLERARRYATWLRVVSALTIYWYWRGVARELKSLRALRQFLSETGDGPEPEPELVLQLEGGVEAAADRLEAARPMAVALFHGDQLIGRIPALPGTEPLRGRHLRPALWVHFRAPLLLALTQASAAGASGPDKSLAELTSRSAKAWRKPK